MVLRGKSSSSKVGSQQVMPATGNCPRGGGGVMRRPFGKSLIEPNDSLNHRQWSSRCGTEEMKPTSTHEDAESVPGVKDHSEGYRSSDAMSYGVGCRRGSDSALLWLCCRPAAVAPIQPLAWELTCGPKKQKK